MSNRDYDAYEYERRTNQYQSAKRFITPATFMLIMVILAVASFMGWL